MEQLQLGIVLNQIVRLMRRAFDARAREIGVTRPQWLVLYTLADNEGIKQTALAALLEVEPITAGRMIDRMQEAGLVERRPDPLDRRVWRLHVTGEGTRVLDRLRPLAEETMTGLLDGLDEFERAALIASLDKIRYNLLVGPLGAAEE